MDDQDKIFAGKIGLVISFVLWLLCTWRLGFHLYQDFFGRPDPEGSGERTRSHSPSGNSALPTGIEQQWRQRCKCLVPCVRCVTRRRVFHCLLWISTLCDLISYADLSGILPFTSNRILAESIGYFLLNIIGRTFELLSFCIVTEIWLRTAIDARPRIHSRIVGQDFWLDWLTNAFIILTVLLVLSSVSLSLILFCRFPHALNRESTLTMPISMLQTLLEAVIWGFHAVVVTISIFSNSRCVLVLVPSTEWKRRLYLLSKTVGPMLVSCFAYATRCAWLIAAYLNQSRRFSWAWWINFAWIPTATVSIVLLYSTRKRDYGAHDFARSENGAGGSSVHGTDDSLQQSLLRPQPPEEAFRAFHTFRLGEEDAEDSFSLSSPTPQNTSTPAAGDEP